MERERRLWLALTDEDIVNFHEAGPVWIRSDVDVPEEMDDGADGEPEAEDPRQACMPWRLPPGKPAYLGRPGDPLPYVETGEKRAGRVCRLQWSCATQAEAQARVTGQAIALGLPPRNGLSRLDAVFHWLGKLFRS